MCKRIPPKFRESLSKCSADHPKFALWRNISDSHAQKPGRNVITLLCTQKCRFMEKEVRDILCFFVAPRRAFPLSVWRGFTHILIHKYRSLSTYCIMSVMALLGTTSQNPSLASTEPCPLLKTDRFPVMRYEALRPWSPWVSEHGFFFCND